MSLEKHCCLHTGQSTTGGEKKFLFETVANSPPSDNPMVPLSLNLHPKEGRILSSRRRPNPSFIELEADTPCERPAQTPMPIPNSDTHYPGPYPLTQMIPRHHHAENPIPTPSRECGGGWATSVGPYSPAPSPAAPPSPELLAAAGAGGPRQALQAECRQGSRRGSLSGRRRSRHTPQCSRSSSASPPPPAGDDAEAEAAAAAEEAAARFSPPAEPSPGPGLAEAAAAAAAEAAAAEAAIHTPPGAPRGEEGRGARRAGANALATNCWAAAAARPSAATRRLGYCPLRAGRCRSPTGRRPLAFRRRRPRFLFTGRPETEPHATRTTARPRARSQKEPRPGGGTEITGADAVAQARWVPCARGRGPGRPPEARPRVRTRLSRVFLPPPTLSRRRLRGGGGAIDITAATEYAGGARAPLTRWAPPLALSPGRETAQEIWQSRPPPQSPPLRPGRRSLQSLRPQALGKEAGPKAKGDLGSRERGGGSHARGKSPSEPSG